MSRELKNINNQGFSLIELVVVIAVLAILAIIGGPYFLKLINLARFGAAKNHMRDSFTSCRNAPDISLSNPYIPGVAFQSSNCSSLMSATIDNSCIISIDMSTGAKTGWDNSYETCSSIANGSNNNSDNSNDSPNVVTVESILKYSKEEKSQNLKCNLLDASNNPEFLAESKKEGANPKSLAPWYRNMCEEFKQEVALCGDGFPCSNLCSDPNLGSSYKENWCGENEYSLPDWMDQNKMKDGRFYTKQELDDYIKNLVEDMRRLNVMEIKN